MALTNKIIKGSDLMLFKDGQSIAHASNHTLNITPEVSEISSKDTGLWTMSEVTKIGWNITAEHLYVQSAFENMFNLGVTSGDKFQVYFGLKKGYKGGSDYNSSYSYNVTEDGAWTPDTNTYMLCGYVLIDSIDISAQAGDNATFSVSMTGVGPLSLGYYTAN